MVAVQSPVETCVLLHGFTGLPMELDPLHAALNDAGYQVEAPALAGHDGTYSSLRYVKCEDWISSAELPVRQAALRGPVHIIGFSMGALVAVMVSLSVPVASLTLLSPAVYYAHPVLLMRQLSLWVHAKLKPDGPERSYLNRRPSGFLWTPPHALREFRRLVVMARGHLPNVTTPMCIVQGEQDEIVHPSGASLVCAVAGSSHCEMHLLAHSRHHVCLDAESQTVIKLIMTFIGKTTTTRTSAD